MFNIYFHCFLFSLSSLLLMVRAFGAACLEYRVATVSGIAYDLPACKTGCSNTNGLRIHHLHQCQRWHMQWQTNKLTCSFCKSMCCFLFSKNQSLPLYWNYQTGSHYPSKPRLQNRFQTKVCKLSLEHKHTPQLLVWSWSSTMVCFKKEATDLMTLQ